MISSFWNKIRHAALGALSVISAVTIGAGLVVASTTISTNISTDGTLDVTGKSTMVNSTSTMLSAYSAYFGGSATSSFSSAGALTLITDLTLQNGETISNSTNGTVTIAANTGTPTLKLVGIASTSALIVGDEPAAPTISGLVFGYCTFSNKNITASTTDYIDCTTTPAGALLAGDRVFVQATSSFQSMYVIQAASTTGVSTINLRVLNTGLDGTADATVEGTSINFWAVR